MPESRYIITDLAPDGCTLQFWGAESGSSHEDALERHVSKQQGERHSEHGRRLATGDPVTFLVAKAEAGTGVAANRIFPPGAKLLTVTRTGYTITPGVPS